MIAAASAPPAILSDDVSQTCDAPELVELSLLLPRYHFQALERAANERGLTIGQYLRRVIGESARRP